MSRYFAKISKEELAEKINEVFPDGFEDYNLLKEKFGSDLKVEFDCENFEFNEKHYNLQLDGLTGYVTLENGLTLAGVTAGGDWEHPIYFAMYWDGKKLRAYVPKDGNPWNTSTNKAYGNDEEVDAVNCQNRFDVSGPEYLDFDGKAIKKDILSRIKEVSTEKKVKKPAKKVSTEKSISVGKPEVEEVEESMLEIKARELFKENCMYVTHGKWKEDMTVVNEQQFMKIIKQLSDY